MKVAVISLNNPRVYPALNDLARGLADAGAEVSLLSTILPQVSQQHSEVHYVQIPEVAGKGLDLTARTGASAASHPPRN